MVGRGQEQPEVMQRLLDVSQTPCKPQYSMAPEDPLLLYACEFGDINWQRSKTSLERNLATLHAAVQQHTVAAALTGTVYQHLQELYASAGFSESGGMAATKTGAQQHQEGLDADQQQQLQVSYQWLPPLPPHLPLRKRATEPSMEERFEKAGIDIELLNKPGQGPWVQG